MRNGTPGFNRAKLVEAREARGIITREAMAKRIGRSASTVQRWEEGDSSPEPDALRLLAEALHVRPEHFVRESVDEPKPVFFRSLASALKREKAYQRARIVWLQDIARVIQHYVELPAVDLPDVLAGTSFKMLRGDDIERIARDLRAHWKLGDGPCPDVVAHMERIGFVVASEEMGTVKLDGLCKWSDVEARPYVLLAADKMSFARRQMDAAHEMSHGVLHRGLTESELKENFELIEEQAFRLASAFLLPHTSYPEEVRALSLPAFEVLKQRWKVSIKAQIRRLKELDIIDVEYARVLYKAYSAKGWTRGEPFDDVWPLQRPRALAEGLNAIVDAQVRTKSELLNSDFTVPAADVESLCGLPEGWFGRDQGSIVRLVPRIVEKHNRSNNASVLPFKSDDS